MNWLRSFFSPTPPLASASDAKYFDALTAAEDLLIANRSLQQQLKPFRNMNDPFGAIRKAAKIAAEWESVQEPKIYKGAAR
jgi:hypothetical protein